MNKASYQVAIVGAGPAGMAAAIAAAECGLRVAVFDQQPRPGGQIYRDIERQPRAQIELLGADYARGLRLVQGFHRAALDYFPRSRVWHLQPGSLGVVENDRTREIAADFILIASGAQERPMPFPGWQLPGVISAGAAQVLLKSASMLPSRAPLLAGSGPLLWLLAWQYLRAGVDLAAIVDTTPADNWTGAWPRLPQALVAGGYLLKGVQLLAAVRRARVPVYRHASNLSADGEERLRALEFDAGGQRHRLDTELLMLHQGVIPSLSAADASGCDIDWNERQQCWQVAVDRWGETSIDGIFVAGDGAAIGGARVAEISGHLAAMQIACKLGVITHRQRNLLVGSRLWGRARHLAVRPFLDAYYRLSESQLAPVDAALVCRCEEISAGEIRAVVAQGCSGPNQAKAFTRCGMGACQGRMCGPTVTQIFAQERGLGASEIGRYRVRPPLQPVTLGQLTAGAGEQT